MAASVFSEKINPQTTNLPQEAIDVVLTSLDQALTLTNEHNARVQRLNEAKASDPTNVEVLDAKWKQIQESGADKEIVKLANQFDKIAAEYERLNSLLREKAKGHIQPPLSADEVTAMRKQVNEGKAAIETARNAAAGQCAMVDAMLAATGNAVEGGVISLLPELASLKSARGGRKAGTGATYATRANDVFIDGESVGRDANGKVKANFAIAAEVLSEKFGSSEFPENGVTGDEIERAYFDSLGKPFRGVESKELPDSHEFEFEKTVTRNNKNGDQVSEPVKVKIRHEKWTQAGKAFPKA